jgi:S-adenosylmethionine:diacylglycerol 3-amino-3-carboxypropyl transferase
MSPDLAPSRGNLQAPGPGRLVFGQMFEDHGVEVAVLPVGRVLCIASAGDTAFALATQGSEVTAVDVNPAQLRYVEHRLSGGPVELGSADRLLRVGRTLLRHTGWRRADIDGFCGLEDPAAQLQTWRDKFDTRSFRIVLGTVLSPASVRSAGFSAFTTGLGTRFDVLMRARLAIGIGTHSNRTNPLIRRLLAGTPVPVGIPARDSVRLLQVDLLEHLEHVPSGSYHGFSLSNVLDGATAQYAARLRAAVRNAAAPGAVAVYRSFAPARVAEHAIAARRDRSMLWGALEIERPSART